MGMEPVDDRVRALVEEAYEDYLAGDWETVGDLLPRINDLYSQYVFQPPPVTVDDIRDFSVQLPTGPLLCE